MRILRENLKLVIRALDFSVSSLLGYHQHNAMRIDRRVDVLSHIYETILCKRSEANRLSKQIVYLEQSATGG